MKTMDAQDFIEIKSLRHKMHVTHDFSEWIDLFNSVNEAITELSSEYEIEKCDLPYITTEHAWCDRDDCELEDCPHCTELESELMDQHKESVNTIIEDWLEYCEQFTDDELRPSGMARLMWAENC